MELKNLSGAKWRMTHQATVDAILGAGCRRVFSFGSNFFNEDSWTARALVVEMTRWAEKFPRQTPTRHDIQGWVQSANASTPAQKRIVIASTPDDLPHGLAMALVGGGCHEAWHTKYDRNTALRLSEVETQILSRWSLVKSWGPLATSLLMWDNYISDIRIERLGCAEYPGTPEKMEALQDLILQMEQDGRKSTLEKGIPTNDHLAVLCGAFRDIGLGYSSSMQQAAMNWYQERSPIAYAMVTTGPLRPLLDRAINQTRANDLEHLWIAMDVVAILADISEAPPPPKAGKGEAGPGSGQKSSGGGGGECEGQGEGAEKGGSGEGAGKGDKEGNGKGGGKGDGDPKKGDKEGSGDGDPKKGDKEGKGGSKDGKNEGDKGGKEGAGGHGAGGHHEATDAEIKAFVKELIDAIRAGGATNLFSNNEALKNAIDAKVYEDCASGEVPWRPENPELDQVKLVGAQNLAEARAFRDTVRFEIAAIKSRLRMKFLEARQPKTLHGVPRGRTLSDRRLVDSIIELRSGVRPTRPDEITIIRDDCTLDVAVVLDQSGSMRSHRENATKAMIAVTDAVASLGCAVLVVGPRDGTSNGYHYTSSSSGCHRRNGVIIDVFKDWEEPMTQALARFTATKATGGTPLEDGIQYAMQEMSNRTARYRVILVITDGMPNNKAVCKRQIRLAAASGVSIIGIGIGVGRELQQLFPLNVAVNQVSEMPVGLVQLLEGIVFPKKGRRISLDGTFNTKRKSA